MFVSCKAALRLFLLLGVAAAGFAGPTASGAQEKKDEIGFYSNDLLLPVLRIASEERKDGLSIKEATDAVVGLLDLDESVKGLRYEKSKGLILRSRVSRAKEELLLAGLAISLGWDSFEASDVGKRCASNPPEDVVGLVRDLRDGRVNEGAVCLATADDSTPREENPADSDDEKIPQVDGCPPYPGPDSPPEERMEHAYCEARKAFEAGLKVRLKPAISDPVDSDTMDPSAFERLILKILEHLGYGRAEHTGGSADGGVDGVIVQDPLGLDRIVVQTKHYKAGNCVGAPEMRDFIGSMMLRNVDRGIFVTSSCFTQGASEAAGNSSGLQIRTIDGDGLVHLMIQSGAGVRARTSYELLDIDEDFFEDN